MDVIDMIPGYYKGNSLSIHYADPVWKSGRSTFLETIDYPVSYTQEVSLDLGYDKASLVLPATLDACAEWMTSGVGRDILVVDPYTDTMFECFVNKVTVSQGRLSMVIGPLIDVVNMADLVHSILDVSTGNQVEGSKRTTSVEQDANSVNKFGILYNRLNGGGAMTIAEANQVLTMYVSENRNPKIDFNLNFGSEDQLYLSLDMLGYIHLASRYSYTNLGTGTVTATAKIQAALSAHPNAIFSTDYSMMSTNTLPIKVNEAGDVKALSVIRDVVNRGDTSNRNYLFGIYSKRRPIYSPVSPVGHDYTQHLFDNNRVVYDIHGEAVYPWEIKVGRWLVTLDYLSTYNNLASMRDDTRATLISKVSFSMPFDYTISGDVIKFLPQKLARMGLGGL